MGLLEQIDSFFSGRRRRSSGKKRRTSHAENVGSIESLGFEVLDLRGWHEGRYQPRRYHLVDKNGVTHDNDGVGYQSTKAALRAATLMSTGDATPTPVVVNR